MPRIDSQDVYEIENGSLEAEILNIDVSNSNSHKLQSYLLNYLIPKI